MNISNSRALEILNNQSQSVAKMRIIPESLRGQLNEIVRELKPEMIGESINPEAAIHGATFIGIQNDIIRILTAERGLPVANSLAQFNRGFWAICNKVNNEGLSVMLKICDVIDAIADELAGED